MSARAWPGAGLGVLVLAGCAGPPPPPPTGQAQFVVADFPAREQRFTLGQIDDRPVARAPAHNLAPGAHTVDFEITDWNRHDLDVALDRLKNVSRTVHLRHRAWRYTIRFQALPDHRYGVDLAAWRPNTPGNLACLRDLDAPQLPPVCFEPFAIADRVERRTVGS